MGISLIFSKIQTIKYNLINKYYLSIMERDSENLQNTRKEDHFVDDIENVSYTYWKRESDTPFSNQFVPQKSNPNLVEDASKNTNTNYGSVWNKAGTWEEKHFTKNQIEQFINSNLSEKSIEFENYISLDKISSFSGDVNLKF